MIRRITFCSLVFLYFLSIIAQGQINHQVNFSSEIEIKEEILDDGETYSQIKIPGMNLMDSVGFPSLPVKYLTFIVPSNATDLNVIINSTQKQKYKLQYKVEPLQKPILVGFDDKSDFVKPDKEKYNSNAPYPSQLAKIVERGFFKGNHLVTVALFPCQYYPNKDELEYFETVNFTLNYLENEKKIENFSKIKVNSKFRKILESVIDNPSDIARFSNVDLNMKLNPDPNQKLNLALMSAGSGISVRCDYVVITSQSLAPEYNEFIAWKRRKGIDIKLVTIEDIYANYTGDNISGINDNAGKLRQFLSEFYDSNKEEQFVLLGGDNTILPIRYARLFDDNDDESYVIPTDLYFAEFHGDWEVDNDGRYGEPIDNVHYYPDIYIGRLMVSNSEEIENWTNKITSYEINPGNGDYAYLTSAFFTQADEMQDQNVAEYILNRAFWITKNTTFEELGGSNTTNTPSFPTGNDVISEFNKHYGFTSFIGHGGPCNVAVATKGKNLDEPNSKYKVTSFDDGDGGCCLIDEAGNGFDNMTNIDHPSIYYSASCETMPFDDYNTPIGDRNMGETYTCITKGGGPAYLGNTRSIYLSESKKIFAEFVGLISHGTTYNLGIAEAISKIKAINVNYARLSHNLIGCPETEIWTASPSKFTSASVSESGSDITVSTGGVSNSIICIMSALDNGSSYHVVKPGVSSWTFTNVPKPYLVTITKHNFIPYIKNPDNIYIQNESIYSDKYIYGKYFYAGENVTPSKPTGLVKIKNGSNVVFDAFNDVNLEGGFEVELGGEFEVK